MKNLIILVFAFLAGCGGQEPSPASTQQEPQSAVASMAKMGGLAADPFAQMSFTFEGNPAAEQIQERLDKVLPMYGVDLNDENRSQAGRTLVALRKQHSRSEMEILEKLLSTPADGATFETAANRIAAEMNQ